MKRVTGIGGIFFQARDPVALRGWYQRHLGIDVLAWGGAAFPWSDPGGSTIWSVGAETFGPNKVPFMINYRVDDVRTLVKVLKDEGCDVMDKVDESEYGVFGWVVDPEGNKVELWQPPREQ